ncbi:hypothetical protein E1301_Tti004776 [Triplophysa tibetana]|uniref:High mobility group protein HMGI-C n=1 Tax=Triplophysa tibetana TaxID=1572043 RepID=A0A5A9NV77_9TELE|nr:hypothetical protein E1301_Tti004776 [Triplophysa tibetana]
MDVEETEASHAETPVPKRSRGRPRKPPQESEEASGPRRPRGRPKGSKNKGQRVTARVEPTGERRPRGRPRKWPQKTAPLEEMQGRVIRRSGHSDSAFSFTTAGERLKLPHKIFANGIEDDVSAPPDVTLKNLH